MTQKLVCTWRCDRCGAVETADQRPAAWHCLAVDGKQVTLGRFEYAPPNPDAHFCGSCSEQFEIWLRAAR